LAQTIQVPDGHGGMQVYCPPPKPPVGPTHVSVGNSRGEWVPFVPAPKPPPGPTGISVVNERGDWVPYFPKKPITRAPQPLGHVKRGKWTYFLFLDRNTNTQFIQIEDENGRDVHVNGEIVYPGPGSDGQMHPVR